jgi:uncharacterized protein
MKNIDIYYVIAATVVFLFDHFVLWPAFNRRVAIYPGKARLQYWFVWMTLMWGLVVGGMMIWSRNGRNWQDLGLRVEGGWRGWVGIGLVVAVLLLYSRDTARVARSEKARARLRAVYHALFKILPHTRLELLCFLALSLTAGFCEEFLFRGYLIWFLQPSLGWWGAAGVGAVVFAVGHSYQGLSGILRTGILGIIMTLAYFITRSLWPAIALHALIDIGSGVMGWLILRESIGPDEMRPAAA